MLDKLTEKSRRNYNKKAPRYEDTFDARFTLPFNLMICENAIVKDGDAVLDVACGNGRLLRLLSRKAEIRAYGVDVSEEMINACKRESPDMDFKVSSADRIPYDEGMFDLVTVSCAFHHFSKPEAFIHEACRVLRDGGRLMIADPYLPPLARHIANMTIMFSPMGDKKIYGRKELQDFLESSNFTDIKLIKKGFRIVATGIKS